MADQVTEPLFTLEDLLRPVPPLPPDLDRPVCKRTHDNLLHSLDVLQASIIQLRMTLVKMPRFDTFTDKLRENVARALDEAGTAYATFIETRDCEGEA